MFRKAASALFLVLAVVALSSFRLPASGGKSDSAVYDVRGAFVTVAGGIDPVLGREIESHLKAAIRATVRTEPLPRVIVSLRVDEMTHKPFLFGHRQHVRFTVKVASVADGSVIAVGVYSARSTNGWALPEKVAWIAGKALSLAPPSGMSVAMALEAAFQP
ncbi:hypothetical protein NOF55_11405 [Rhizobiaceae bacterium BDR2-2]|uniref:Uncharacterized protein n=1 Tax=Ectorhizobium quercum TaxID=2965071 RepID=A0AAE3MZ36_9HYPH|nr:hypothetical protein [Ectorhizobium quercum]MCX8997708.1 hypothetical protein [Ectorhizobium quercum]